MAITSTSEGAPTVVDLETIYSEVRTAIRETDSISFKLLGLVPLVSGTALIGLLLQTQHLPSGLLVILALFASSVTLGLFRWELRNVQTCSWLIRYAEALEAHALTATGMGGLFRPRPKSLQSIGKTEAEKFIYATTILAWLTLPVVADALQPSSRNAYFYIAGVILLGTVVSLFAKPRVPRIANLLQPTSGVGPN